jgi:hypothetical protein
VCCTHTSLSAKYKKFTSEAQAAAFVSGGPTPYSATNDRNDLPLSSSSASSGGVARTSSSSGPSDPSGSSRGASGAPGSLSRARSASPPTHSAPSDLPGHLQEIAGRGYTFSKPPHHLVVYTDGSGLDNGKPSARAGMGVWWGSHGEAKERGLAERVPGELQTNNRGELLVSEVGQRTRSGKSAALRARWLVLLHPTDASGTTKRKTPATRGPRFGSVGTC